MFVKIQSFITNDGSQGLRPYIDQIIGDHKCGFRRNRSTTDKISCIRQILEKNGSTMRHISKLQERISFSLEGSIVQYPHRV
jgi:hypothetical protein